MSGQLIFRYTIDGDDFTRAGEASSSVKNKLKMLGLSADVTRRVAIAMLRVRSTWSSMRTAGRSP